MKKVLAFFLALLLCCSFASAEETDAARNSIAGSSASALLEALEDFGIDIPYREKTELGYVWKTSYEEVNGVRCGYSILANESGEIINATFTMREKDNGLFNIVAAMNYDAANPAVAKSFVKSSLGTDAALTIGDAKFSNKKQVSTSTASITIGSWSRSSTSKTTEYILKIEYTDEASDTQNVARITKNVNIRAKNTAESTKLGNGKVGDEFIVLTPYFDGSTWHQILFNGEVAYVSANYCELITENK